jgi:hypothetical protein
VSSSADLYRVPHRKIEVGRTDWGTQAPECFHAYVVSREGAARLLVGIAAVPGHAVDWVPAFIGNTIEIYTISPALITQARRV